MSTILESNSRVDDMTTFELMMHEDISCDTDQCDNSAEWRGKFCRPCGANALLCSNHKSAIEGWIKRQSFIQCTLCDCLIDHRDIIWTKI